MPHGSVVYEAEFEAIMHEYKTVQVQLQLIPKIVPKSMCKLFIFDMNHTHKLTLKGNA